MIHRKNGIELAPGRLSENRIRDVGAGEDSEPFTIQGRDRRRDDPGLLVAKAAVLSGVRVQPRDGNAGQAPRTARGELREQPANRHDARDAEAA